MKWFREGMTLDDVFEQVRTARRAVLMTDYDGTLAPFVYDRDRAKPYIGLLPVFNEIASLEDSRLVVISGRRIEDLSKLFRIEAPVELWGTHGWERQDVHGQLTTWPITESQQEGINEVVQWAQEENFTAHMESKPASVAIHWRGTEARRRDLISRRAHDVMKPIAEERGLRMKEFEGGLELRAPGRNKGQAVNEVLDDLGGDDVFVAYLGDAQTDEDAFKMIGDRGLNVLVRDYERDTAADLWLRPPRELRRFLERWRDARLPA